MINSSVEERIAAIQDKIRVEIYFRAFYSSKMQAVPTATFFPRSKTNHQTRYHSRKSQIR